MQGLLVGEHRGHDHADPDSEFALAQRGERAEQEGRDGGHLGREPEPVRIHPHAQHVARQHGGGDCDEAGGQQPRRGEHVADPAAQRAEQGHQHEGAQARDLGMFLALLVPLALDADQRADQQRGGEAPGQREVECRHAHG